MNSKPTLPLSKQITYALGQLGWSILVNLIGLMLVYFYLPPETAGLPFFITQVVFLGVLNVLTIVAASGRLVDAITDPLIASYSDRFDHKASHDKHSANHILRCGQNTDWHLDGDRPR